MRVITWKHVGIAAAVVAVGSIFAVTGRAATRADEAPPELQRAQQPHGCLLDQTNKESLLAQARSFTYGTTRGSEDTQVLWWFRIPGDPNSGLVAGPEATASPEDSARTRTLDSNGIFVGRVEIERGHGRDGYPELGFPEGISYVKICRQTTGSTYQLHALIIPESGELRQGRVRHNADRDYSPVAKALWEWDPKDDHLCWTCGPWWCELF